MYRIVLNLQTYFCFQRMEPVKEPSVIIYAARILATDYGPIQIR